MLRTRKISDDKLYTVDFACHGVPSPKLFADYIAFLKRDPLFQRFAFRTKKLPWGYGSATYGCTIFRKNGTSETDTDKARLFLEFFFSNHCLRPSCYGCRYATINKPSDITMMDYWGLKDAHPDFFDEAGVSAVITRTDKGDRFFNTANLERIESTIEKIQKKQLNLKQPSPRSEQYDAFWQDYEKNGFMYVAKKYCGYSAVKRIKRMIKRLLIR